MKRFSVVGIMAYLIWISIEAQAAHPSYETIATGLNNPRGIAFGPDGALYIAEAGIGGIGPCLVTDEGTYCYGPSGAITRVFNGVQTRVATGLPSLAINGSEATGPSGVYVAVSGEIYVLIGMGGSPEDRSDPAKLNNADDRLGYLLHWPVNSSEDRIADLVAYEAAHNPDGGEIDSNPHAFTMDGDNFIVVDAGANALLKVDAQGVVSTLAVFPNKEVTPPPFLPQDPPTLSMQPVPDSVTVGPDGAYYVGQLTGFPFPVGQAQVFRVVPGQQPSVYTDGFTNIIGLAFDKDKNLYVLEIRENSLLSEDTTGALYRVSPNGNKVFLMDEGLTAPTAIAIGPDGLIYINNHGVTPGQGEVIRFDPKNLPLSAVDSQLWENY